MAQHIIEDKNGKQIKINAHNSQQLNSYLGHLIYLGHDRIGQCGGHGICGRCNFKVEKGRIEQTQESLHDMAENEGLACCNRPNNDEDSHIVFEDVSFSR